MIFRPSYRWLPSRRGCRTLALVPLSLGTAAPALASNAGSTTATQVIAAIDGHVYFEGSQNRSARPDCATYTRWAIDITTPSGQAILSVLMTGIASGKTFNVAGQGICANNSELVYYIQFAE